MLRLFALSILAVGSLASGCSPYPDVDDLDLQFCESFAPNLQGTIVDASVPGALRHSTMRGDCTINTCTADFPLAVGITAELRFVVDESFAGSEAELQHFTVESDAPQVLAVVQVERTEEIRSEKAANGDCVSTRVVVLTGRFDANSAGTAHLTLKRGNVVVDHYEIVTGETS
jgi:hypothetical protein